MEKNSFYITEHAYSRMRQRNGWSRKTADRMVRRVYSCGQRPEQIKGYLKFWMKTKVGENINGNEFVLYGQKVYVFKENMLITVLHTPSKGYIVEYLF